MGELRALGEMSGEIADLVTPLVELPLTVSEVESELDDDLDAPSPLSVNPGKFATDLMRRWQPDRSIIVDATAAPLPLDGVPTTVDIVNRLASEDFSSVVPTVRPSDDLEVIDAVGASIAQWGLDTACIRLSGDDLDDVDLPIATAISVAQSRLELEPEQIHLVLDFGPVQDEHAVSFAARIARLVLGEIPNLDRWKTLVCAAAGFPPDLNTVQPEVLTELPRYDAMTWEAIAARHTRRTPDFGDYAIAYPTVAAGVAFAPAPQLRFTWEQHWLIYKGRKRDRRGSAQFYDICERMIQRGAVDPALSWGDAYVEEAGRLKEHGAQKTGNAMIWRAIGTSHHLAYVASRLASRGAP